MTEKAKDLIKAFFMVFFALRVPESDYFSNTLIHRHDPQHKMFQGVSLGIGPLSLLFFGLFEPSSGNLLVFLTAPTILGYLLRQIAGSVFRPLHG